MGTAHVIRTAFKGRTSNRITLNLKAGKIPVVCEETEKGRTIYWMKRVEPTFGSQLPRQAIAPVLDLLEEVSTGLPHMIAPLRTLDSLKKANMSKDTYFDLIKDTWAESILVFSPEPHRRENHTSTRMFADYLGIPENPATGSGNGCLAGYLVRHRYSGVLKLTFVANRAMKSVAPPSYSSDFFYREW